MRLLLSAVLLSAALALPAAAQDPIEAEVFVHADGVVEELALVFPATPAEATESGEDSPAAAGQVLWAEGFFRPGSGSMQLRIENRGTEAAATGWIEIVDGSGEIVERIDAARLAAEGEIWTNLAFGAFIEIAVIGDQGTGLSFAVAAISFEKSGTRVESPIGPDQRQHLIAYNGPFSAVLPSVEGAVAKLTFIGDRNGLPARFVCTGFLIADDLLLTNEHCVATQPVCDTTKVLFGFAVNQFGIARPKEQVRCLKVEKASFPLDYALLRLDGNPGQRWGRLQLADRSLASGEKIFIVQHPAGEAKQISDADCKVAGTAVAGRGQKTDLSHSCDTLGGSSGSPVFDASGKVIGLHHLGKQNVGTFANLNRAVLMTKILAELSP